MQSFDLIIVGGGLVGTGLAVALGQSGLRLALIDARLPSQTDQRMFALNNGSCQFLTQLGLWPQLTDHASPIREVHVTRQRHFGSVRLQSETVRTEALGQMIPACKIEAALHHALKLSACTLYRPATVTAITQQENSVSLSLTTENTTMQLNAAIVIAADGSHSTVRDQLNIPVEVVDYGQRAIVTHTELARSHQHIAYERFTKTGAIAMLPLKDAVSATIWSADNATAAQLLALSDQDFLQALQKEFGYKLGRLQKVSQRHTYPLQMLRAKQAVLGRVLLLGNASHTLHPIAAQGFNLALYEVAALVKRIRQKQAAGKTLTTHDLQDVHQQTMQQQKVSIFTSHHLAELFSHSSFIMSVAWQLGMLGFDMATPIKRQFMTRMLGKGLAYHG